jgi:hypothetical protein
MINFKILKYWNEIISVIFFTSHSGFSHFTSHIAFFGSAQLVWHLGGSQTGSHIAGQWGSSHFQLHWGWHYKNKYFLIIEKKIVEILK